MAVRGFRGVRDDLSELGRHLLDIACFLSPLLPPPHHDSPPLSPRLPAAPPPSPRLSSRALAGILSDLAEIGGGFRSGLSRLSGAFRSPADRYGGYSDRAGYAGTVGVSEEVLEFVSDLVKCPESWLDFPVSVDDPFSMSGTQREHISTVEDAIPDLQSLRLSLCPTYMSEEYFWRIYFTLLHPKLSKHDSELLSTSQILDSMRITAKETSNRPSTQSKNLDSESLPSLMSEKCSSIQQEHNEAWQDALITKSRSQLSIDQWSEVTNPVDASSDTIKFVPDDVSLRDTTEGNVLVMEKYMDSLLTEEEQVRLPYSFGRKHVSADEEIMINRKMSKLKMSSDEESGDWQAVEDSDFEILEKSSANKSTESFHRHT
ncbi:BSD domain containing protein [Musa troglodytarum]|uniref:BSD domain containing protein n=1 Tax=Musa troglodytarum TaxID=320322 RepID=A0A9E7KED7_9LILI|nr:BSD domain containing protein [Musa troglodytarum]